MTREKIIEGYVDVVRDLLQSEQVKSMTQYEHHGKIDTHFHSIHVSYFVYKWCRMLGYDDAKTSEITRASLLHDLYLYNWPTDKHEELHAFYHPKESVRNIEKYGLLDITPMQREMILRHMFPLGGLPNSVGGWLLTISDKHCANSELLKVSGSFNKIYDSINDKVD